MPKKPEDIAPNTVTAAEETVFIRLPINKENEGDVFVRINERTWLIQRGVRVEVPRIVADLIAQQEEAEQEMYERRRKLRNN